jgi:hypothetical protein
MPAMYGWAAAEIVKIIAGCERFYRVYREDGREAAEHFQALDTQVHSFKCILEQLKDDLDVRDSKLYGGLPSIQRTIEGCQDFLDKHPVWFQPARQRAAHNKFTGTIKYLHSARQEANMLGARLESDTRRIQIYLHVLDRHVNGPS